MTRRKIRPALRAPLETSEQRTLVAWMRMRGIRHFAVPNGAILGGRNKWGLLNKLKAEGMLPGAPDLVLIDPAPRTGEVVCLELKRRKGGKLSKSQEAVLDQLYEAGWHVIVANGAKEAMQALLALGY